MYQETCQCLDFTECLVEFLNRVLHIGVTTVLLSHLFRDLTTPSDYAPEHAPIPARFNYSSSIFLCYSTAHVAEFIISYGITCFFSLTSSISHFKGRGQPLGAHFRGKRSPSRPGFSRTMYQTCVVRAKYIR